MGLTKYDELNETLYTYTHDSGLKLYLVPKKGFSKSCFYYATHYGSIDNHFIPIGGSEYITVPDGIAHFLEHKLFEQQSGGNVFEAFGAQGGFANAYTSFDSTAYHFFSVTNTLENLKILIDFVQNPYFTDENVAKEQGIIGQEINMYQDNPNWMVYFNMLRCLYHAHPVKRDIAGTIESIGSITKEVLYTCYNTFYHPSNMVLCGVGDFNPDETAAFIFGQLKSVPPSPAASRRMPQEDRGIAQKEAQCRLSVSMPIFCIGFKDTPVQEPLALIKKRMCNAIALKLLFGKSAAIYTKLYDEGLIDGSFGTDYTCEESYAFSELMGMSKDPMELQKQIVQAIRNPQILKEDFERIKRSRLSGVMSAFDDPEDYADKLSRYFAKGLNLFDILPMHNSITFEDVLTQISEHFREENMVMSVVLPNKE